MNLTKNKILVTLISLAGILLATIFVLGFFVYFESKGANQNNVEEEKRTKSNTLKEGVEKDQNKKDREREKVKEGENTSVKLLFFGDMMLDRNVGRLIDREGLDYIFENLAVDEGLLSDGFDLVSANLEGAVTDGGAHYLPDNLYDFAFDPEVVAGLGEYNFNFFNLANNHLRDQGKQGVEETYDNLEELGYNFSGCVDGKAGDCSSKIIEKGDKEIGLVGFSMVYSIPDRAKMVEIVKKTKEKSDFVVVNVHWGVEYKHRHNRVQQSIGHSLVDAGADLIIGHHPHVVQGMEIYKDVPIFYSLGNFVFDQYFSEDTQEGLAAGVNWDKEKLNVHLFPYKSKQGKLYLMKDKEKEKFLKEFLDWSSLGSRIKKEIRRGVFTLD